MECIYTKIYVWRHMVTLTWTDSDVFRLLGVWGEKNLKVQKEIRHGTQSKITRKPASIFPDDDGAVLVR